MSFNTVSFIVFLFLLSFVDARGTIKIRSLTCDSSSKSLEPKFKCFSKSYSRKLSVGNVDFVLTRKLEKFWVEDQIFELFLLIKTNQ